MDYTDRIGPKLERLAMRMNRLEDNFLEISERIAYLDKEINDNMDTFINILKQNPNKEDDYHWTKSLEKMDKLIMAKGEERKTLEHKLNHVNEEIDHTMEMLEHLARGKKSE